MKMSRSPTTSFLSLRSVAAALPLLLLAVTQAADVPTLKAGVFSPPRQAPDFSLQGSNGRELKLSQYRGKIVVLGFGFTSCAEVCPTTLATLAQTRRKLVAAAGDVQIVYVTVDPERDVAERMKKYLAAFDPTFIGGTGTVGQLAAVRKDYGVFAAKQAQGNSYSVAHSSSTYLIDRRGRLRALMPYGHGSDDYAHDLQILLKE
jgi:protein SCO1/2